MHACRTKIGHAVGIRTGFLEILIWWIVNGQKYYGKAWIWLFWHCVDIQPYMPLLNTTFGLRCIPARSRTKLSPAPSFVTLWLHHGHGRQSFILPNNHYAKQPLRGVPLLCTQCTSISRKFNPWSFEYGQFGHHKCHHQKNNFRKSPNNHAYNLDHCAVQDESGNTIWIALRWSGWASNALQCFLASNFLWISLSTAWLLLGTQLCCLRSP